MSRSFNKTLKFTVIFLFALIITGEFDKNVFAQKVRLRSQVKPECVILPPHRVNQFFGEISADGNIAAHGSLGCVGVFIYDISNPDAPVLANWYKPTETDPFHEVVVVGNRGYFGSSKDKGVHIVDLTDPYHPVFLGKVDSKHGNGFNRVHEMVVWGNYLIENFHGSPNRINKFINISDPANPVFVREITTAAEGGWSHAMHVRGNRMFISNFGTFNQRGRTEIYDISNIETQTPVLLGTIIDNTVPHPGGDDWTHSSWTSEDGNYLYSCREKYENLPNWEGGDLRVYDIHNPAQAVLVNRISTIGLGLNAWTPHNPIVKGNFLYVAWYHAGLQVFDISNPANPIRVGQYDTNPVTYEPLAENLNLTENKSKEVICGLSNLQGDDSNFGAWTAIPLSEDKVVIGDMGNGMFIVDTSQADTPLKNRVSDFDGDGRTDYSTFSPSSGLWQIERSSDTSPFYSYFGLNTDKLVTGDYDGDGKSDIAVFRPSTGIWYFLGSTNGFYALQFGLDGDIPTAADYDADGKTDVAVFRPSNGVWYIWQSTLGFKAIQWGLTGDKPVTGDFEGDGKADLAVFRPSDSIWYILKSSSSEWYGVQFGLADDKPVSADFDGDGKNELAVYRPSTGVWYMLKSSDNSFFAIQFGLEEDLPIAGDYDGDGKADIAVYRPSTNVWYRLNSLDSSFIARVFGTNGDIPSPSSVQPE
jgi:hypothetical protein